MSGSEEGFEKTAFDDSRDVEPLQQESNNVTRHAANDETVGILSDLIDYQSERMFSNPERRKDHWTSLNVRFFLANGSFTHKLSHIFGAVLLELASSETTGSSVGSPLFIVLPLSGLQ
jgi:hypothetical protein